MAVIEIRGRYERYAKAFGKTVHVTVNRPITEPNVLPRYTVNGGYVTVKDLASAGLITQETAAAYTNTAKIPDIGNAPLQFVYIVGVDTQLTSFEGEIIAILHREGRGMPTLQGFPFERYDRLIVAPKGAYLLEPDIRAAIADAERRFRYRLYCRYEKSCGAVVYTVRGGEPYYLLIRNRSSHIGFPKGHMEYGEDERATMIREIFEETALRVIPDLGFREEYHYRLWDAVCKTAVYSVAYFEDGAKVQTLDDEIFGDWLLPYDEARRMLSYENDRTVLLHAHTYLSEKGAFGRK